jgi:hypothetical protein
LPALSHVCHMPCPPHSPWFDLHNNNLGMSTEYKGTVMYDIIKYRPVFWYVMWILNYKVMGQRNLYLVFFYINSESNGLWNNMGRGSLGMKINTPVIRNIFISLLRKSGNVSTI